MYFEKCIYKTDIALYPDLLCRVYIGYKGDYDRESCKEKRSKAKKTEKKIFTKKNFSKKKNVYETSKINKAHYLEKTCFHFLSFNKYSKELIKCRKILYNFETFYSFIYFYIILKMLSALKASLNLGILLLLRL